MLRWLACAALGWILLPFYGAILWAVVIGLVFFPVFNWLLGRMRGQIDLAAHVASLHNALPGWLAAMVDRIGLSRLSALQRRLAETLAQGGERLVRSALNVGQDTFGLLAGVFITLYLSFFVVRDGEAIATAVGLNVPIAPDQRQALLASHLAHRARWELYRAIRAACRAGKRPNTPPVSSPRTDSGTRESAVSPNGASERFPIIATTTRSCCLGYGCWSG